MTDTIADLSNYIIVAGLIVLAIEVLILGFSTFILTFFGLALLITGGLIAADAIPSTLLSATGSAAVLTGLVAALLWRPLKKLEKDTEKPTATSDLVGHRFVLEQAISPQQPGSIHYSGVQWKVTADVPLAQGVEVETTKISVGEMKVRRIEG